jgi:hypothetical protein
VLEAPVRRPLLAAGGRAALVALATWPVWRAAGRPVAIAPALARPLAATECVAPVAYMRASHMRLLIAWRDRVVRDGVRTYADARGRVVTMSLSKTCLGCHRDKATFCDRCHDYAGVKPTCWDCHVPPPVTAPPALARLGAGR